METRFADEMCHGEWVIRQLKSIAGTAGRAAQKRVVWRASCEYNNRVVLTTADLSHLAPATPLRQMLSQLRTPWVRSGCSRQQPRINSRHDAHRRGQQLHVI